VQSLRLEQFFNQQFDANEPQNSDFVRQNLNALSMVMTVRTSGRLRGSH
jgi:hypothetical protein